MPYSNEDVDAYAQELQLVFDRPWFMIAEDALGRPWAWPSRCPTSTKSQWMNAFPTGWWHYLNRRRIVDRCRVGFLG